MVKLQAHRGVSGENPENTSDVYPFFDGKRGNVGGHFVRSDPYVKLCGSRCISCKDFPVRNAALRKSDQIKNCVKKSKTTVRYID